MIELKVGAVFTNMEVLRIKKAENGKRKVCYKCLECGYVGEMRADSFLRGSKCTCCVNKVVVEHINSIVAKEENHWMIEYFPGGYEEAKLYTPRSAKKIHMRCPICGLTQSTPRKISDLWIRKHKCEYCSRGKSYCERMVGALLKHLNIEYITQLSSYTFEWCGTKRYDFYIPSLNMIIETHGGQHYIETNRTNLQEIKENDAFKKTLALLNGVENYIELDCSISDFTYIKNSIIKSNLSTILKLEIVNWEEVNIMSQDTLTKEVWDFWNEHENEFTPFQLGKKFNVSKTVISNILKSGAEANMINYDKDKIDEIWKSERDKRAKTLCSIIEVPVEVYKDGVLLGSYSSLAKLENESEKDFGVKLLKSKVSPACKTGKKYKGYNFKKANTVRD